MLMRKWLQTCVLVSGMGSLFVVILVLHGMLSSQPPLGYCSQSLQRSMYKLDLSWPRKPELFTGQVFAVAVNQYAEVVYVAQRGDGVPKVLVFSTGGEFLMSWNTTTLEMPHGMFLADAASLNPTVWITDVGNGPYGHTIKQYSPSGNLLQVLGTPGQAGSGVDPLQFDQPAEIFVHESGEMYIVDGDGGMNNRLIKLSKDQQVLWMHGEKGQGLAQFYIPHSVFVDSATRVWVADRGNKRIQVFNSLTGDWLGSWGSCFMEDAPYSVRLSPNKKYIVVAQLNSNQILLLDAPPMGLIGQCKVVGGIQMADEVKPHLVDLDLKTGDLYVAEMGANQAQKFRPLSVDENPFHTNGGSHHGSLH